MRALFGEQSVSQTLRSTTVVREAHRGLVRDHSSSVIQSGDGSTANMTAETVECPESHAFEILWPPSMREPSEARMTGCRRSAAWIRRACSATCRQVALDRETSSPGRTRRCRRWALHGPADRETTPVVGRSRSDVDGQQRDGSDARGPRSEARRLPRTDLLVKRGAASEMPRTRETAAAHADPRAGRRQRPFGGTPRPSLGELVSLLPLARPELAGRDRKVLRCDLSVAARRAVPLQLVHHHSQYG